MAQIDDAAVQREISTIDEKPVSEEERNRACRAIVRFKGKKTPGNTSAEEQEIDTTEEWVRLYVALRRAGGESARLNAGHLRRWRSRVSLSTTVKKSS